MSDYTPTKICTKCGIEYPATAEHFYKRKEGKYGLSQPCKICHIKITSDWHKEHPEKARDIKRNWANNHPDEKKASQKRYRDNHPDRARASSKRYYLANLDKQRVIRARRRARKFNAEGTHTIEDMQRQYKAQKGLCWWCNKPVEWGTHHEDHLVPLARGGTNWPNNLVITCVHCNLSKNDRLPHEWSDRLL